MKKLAENKEGRPDKSQAPFLLCALCVPASVRSVLSLFLPHFANLTLSNTTVNVFS